MNTYAPGPVNKMESNLASVPVTPPLLEVLAKCQGILADSQNLASKILRVLNGDESLLPDPEPKCVTALAMDNTDRAIALMHTLEQILGLIGG